MSRAQGKPQKFVIEKLASIVQFYQLGFAPGYLEQAMSRAFVSILLSRFPCLDFLFESRQSSRVEYEFRNISTLLTTRYRHPRNVALNLSPIHSIHTFLLMFTGIFLTGILICFIKRIRCFNFLLEIHING